MIAPPYPPSPPNSVTSIGEAAFSGCDSLTSVVWNAKNCKRYNFGSQIESFVFGDSVQVIPSDICSGLLKLTSITIPNSVGSIGNAAFKNCSGLTDIEISNGCKSIGDNAFYGCSNKEFKKIVLPNSIETIGERAFAECSWLKDVTFGTNLEEIGDYAFDNDQRLIYINSYASDPPLLGSTQFANYNAYLKVPCEAVDEYKVSPGWKLFTKENIRCIDAEPATTDSVIVTPDDHSVTITWPTTDGADSYTIVINKGGVPFCILTFNAQGQLTNISFAPGRGMNNAVEAATAVAGGYRFTITSLDPGTQYDYEVDTQDAAGISIANYTGEFTTTGGSATSFDQLPDSPVNRFTKILKDGQLYILREGKTYNAQGGEL